MKHLKIFKKVSVFSVLALTATQLHAGDIQTEGFTLTPMIGLTTHSEAKQNLEDSPTIGLAAGYQFNSPWAMELAYQYANPNVSNESDSADAEQIRIDTLYHFGNDGEVQPFALFGVGTSDIQADTIDLDDTLVNAGLGVKYPINDMLSFRTDFRAIRQLDTEAVQVAVNFGLNFLLGAKTSTAATPKKESDADKDGVIDRLDSCPNTPLNTRVNANGCAIILDSDNDGVVDAEDACPNTSANAKVDAKGCYLTLSEDVVIELKVTFANNSNEVLSGAMEEIAPLAKFMQEYPQTSVAIKGHTDSRGSAAYNKALSQKRADAVAAILIEKFNIKPTRITAIGVGEEQPIATNDTAEGRAQNRRVEGVVKATVKKVVPASP